MLRHTRRNAEVGNVSHGDRRCGVFPITTFRRLIGPITLTFYSLTIRETDTFFFIVPVLHPLISLYFATKVSQKLDPVAAETKWFGVFRFASKWFLGVFCVLVGEGDMTRHEPRDDTGYGVPSGSHKGYPANSHSARDTAHLFVLAIVIFVLYAVNFHVQVRISRSTHSASLITALCGVRNSYCRTQSTTATVTPTHSVGPRTNPGYTSRPTDPFLLIAPARAGRRGVARDERFARRLCRVVILDFCMRVLYHHANRTAGHHRRGERRDRNRKRGGGADFYAAVFRGGVPAHGRPEFTGQGLSHLPHSASAIAHTRLTLSAFFVSVRLPRPVPHGDAARR